MASATSTEMHRIAITAGLHASRPGHYSERGWRGAAADVPSGPVGCSETSGTIPSLDTLVRVPARIRSLATFTLVISSTALG